MNRYAVSFDNGTEPTIHAAHTAEDAATGAVEEALVDGDTDGLLNREGERTVHVFDGAEVRTFDVKVVWEPHATATAAFGATPVAVEEELRNALATAEEEDADDA